MPPASRSGRATSRSQTPAAAAAAADFPAEAAPDFERLRAWRASTAKEQGVPAYVIFHDKTLRTVAAVRPSTRDDLLAVPGIGPVKVERHAAAVLELVRRHAS